MKLQVVDVDEGYLPLLIGSPSMERYWHEKLMDGCKQLFPDFKLPYIMLSFGNIEITCEHVLGRGFHRGQDSTIKDLVEKFEEFFGHEAFKGLDHRNILNFAGDVYDEVLNQLNGYEIKRKYLSMPSKPE